MILKVVPQQDLALIHYLPPPLPINELSTSQYP